MSDSNVVGGGPYAAGAAPVVVNAKPVISLLGGDDVELMIGSVWVDPGYTATDDEDGDVTANVVVSGAVDSSAVGDYTLSYSVVDSGASAADVVQRVVRVVDLSVLRDISFIGSYRLVVF